MDDTTLFSWVTNKSSYLEEINNLAERCTENNLLLNVSKTEELIVDFRKKKANIHAPFHISGAEVELPPWKSESQITYLHPIQIKGQNLLYSLRKTPVPRVCELLQRRGRQHFKWKHHKPALAVHSPGQESSAAAD